MHLLLQLWCCCSGIREAWIKAKYVQRLFVKKLESPRSRTSNAAVRKWSVRKLRRRPRSRDGKRGLARAKPKLEPPAEAAEASTATLPGYSTKEKADFEPSEKSEILLFGKNLDKQPLEEGIDLSSDEDSAGGDDEGDIAGKIFSYNNHIYFDSENSA